MSGKLNSIENKINLILVEMGLATPKEPPAPKVNSTGTTRKEIMANAIFISFETEEEQLFEVKVIPGGSINLNWPANMDDMAKKVPFNIDLPTGKNGEECKRFVSGPAGFRPALNSDEWILK